MDLGQGARLEGEVAFTSREGDHDKGCCSIYSHLFYECFQVTNRKIHCINWSNLCDSKSVGGMGLWDIQRFNNAMLAKQVWHLFHQRDTLLFRVFSIEYFPNGNILDAPIHPKCSYAWKSILQAREVIKNGVVG